MLVLSADILLWLNAVTVDTIHQEIELDREDKLDLGGAVTATSEEAGNTERRALLHVVARLVSPELTRSPPIFRQRWPMAALASAVPASSA